MDGKIILEFKAAKRLTEVMDAQIINYLKVTGLQVGYPMNFGGLRLEWKRHVGGG